MKIIHLVTASTTGLLSASSLIRNQSRHNMFNPDYISVYVCVHVWVVRVHVHVAVSSNLLIYEHDFHKSWHIYGCVHVFLQTYRKIYLIGERLHYLKRKVCAAFSPLILIGKSCPLPSQSSKSQKYYLARHLIHWFQSYALLNELVVWLLSATIHPLNTFSSWFFIFLSIPLLPFPIHSFFSITFLSFKESARPPCFRVSLLTLQWRKQLK